MSKVQQMIDELHPFEPNEVEQNILERLVTGDEAVSGITHNAREQELVIGFPADCIIRGDFLTRLCASRKAADLLSYQGMRISGYRIVGMLALSTLQIAFPLSLRNCAIRDGIYLRNSSIRSLDLVDSFIAGIDAAGLSVAGELRLSEGFTADYPVSFQGARIEGNVNFIGAHFSYPNKVSRCQAISEECIQCRLQAEEAYVLNMEHAKIGGSLYLCGNFNAEGGVLLADAIVGVNVNCTKGTFRSTWTTAVGTLLENGRRLSCKADMDYHFACALNGDGLRIKGNLLMDEITALGEVRLTGADVAGDIESTKGTFLPFGAEAISADRINVGGNVFFADGFRAEGIIRLPSARIGRDLSLFNADVLPKKEWPVQRDQKHTILNCESLVLGGTMYLCNFTSIGCVRLSHSTVNGNLVLRNGTFHNEEGTAIEALGIKVIGSVFMDKGFSAEGIVKFTGSEIGIDFMCTDGQFNANNPCALNMNCVCVGGKMRLDGTFKADGGICLDDSKIGSYLRCDGGMFIAPKRKQGDVREAYAISAGKLTLGGSLYFDWYLDNRFVAEGEVMLNDCSIGRNLKCEGAKMANPVGITLSGSQMHVTGSILLNNKFESHGAVQINNANIGGSLVCTDGRFINPLGQIDQGDPDSYALMAEANRIGGHVYLDYGFEANGRVSFRKTEIAGTLFWVEVKGNRQAELDLRFASAELLEDDPDRWPGKIHLNGFVYNSLHNPTLRLDERLESWVKSPRFRPQPYEQLADVLKRTGYQRLSEKVMIEKNKQEADLPIKWPFSKERTQLEKEGQTQSIGMFLWMHILQYGVCYGYKSIRAVWIALGVTLAMAIFYHHGIINGNLKANEKDGQENRDSFNGWMSKHPKFLSFMYSLDTTLPAINLNIHDHYSETSASNFWINANRVLHVVQTMAGWLLTLLFGAALAGIIRR